MTLKSPSIAILGGTGAMGVGLAKRWARAGYRVVIGSRVADKAQAAAEDILLLGGSGTISGMGLIEAVRQCDLAVLSVPYAHCHPILEQVKEALNGKILIDTTVPLRPPKVGRVRLPDAGSAAQEAQEFLGPEVHVVSALQNISAQLLQGDEVIECDVLVTGDQVDARQKAVELIEAAGLRAWSVGPLANAAAAEAMTSVLIQINKKYNLKHAGLRITGGEGAAKEDTAPAPEDHFSVRALMPFPLVEEDDDLTALILRSLAATPMDLREGDILIIAQKIVSKAQGRRVKLSQVTPSESALELAQQTDKDPRLVELILSESKEVVRHKPGVLVVAHRLGFVMANAGIDQSNVEQEEGDVAVLLLPQDPDASANEIRQGILQQTGVKVGVIISDSVGRAWRNGTVGLALGSAGLTVLRNLKGREDLYGRPLQITETGFADEVAAAASLVMGQADEGRPVVVVRGLNPGRDSGGLEPLLRERDKDLFR